MAEGPGVAVPPDSTGARFRTQEVVLPGGEVVQQEVVTLATADGLLIDDEHPLFVSSRLTDNNGIPYTSTNKLPVDIGGATIEGTFTSQPSVESTLNVPTGPLAANEVFVGQWEDVLNFSAIQIALDTDVASATNGGVVEFSQDGVNVIRAVPTTIPANVQSYFHLSPQARYVRFRYTNGPAAQTRLRVSILFAYNAPAEVIQPIGSTITDLNVATVTRSALASRIMTGPSTGAYLPVGNDGTGRMLVSTGLLQGVTNTELRASPVPISGTVSTTPAPATATQATPPATVTIPTTAAQVLAARLTRIEVIIQNTSATDIYIGLGGNPTITTGIRVPAGGLFNLSGYTGAIHAIALASVSVPYVEVFV